MKNMKWIFPKHNKCKSSGGFSLWKPKYELWIKCKMQHFYYEPWLKKHRSNRTQWLASYLNTKIHGFTFLSTALFEVRNFRFLTYVKSFFGIFWPFIENPVVAFKLLLLAMVPAVWHSIWKYGTWLFLQGNPFNFVQRISIVLRRSRES